MEKKIFKKNLLIFFPKNSPYFLDEACMIQFLFRKT